MPLVDMDPVRPASTAASDATVRPATSRPIEEGGVDGPGPSPTIARSRIAFLSEAGKLLAESLDYETVLQQVADGAVPTLADWCAVDVVHTRASGEWPPEVRRVAVAGRDAAKLAWARKLGADVERDWSSPNGLPQVLRTGAPAFF